MSTHALIGIQNEDGTVRAIYLHSDGYVQQAGQTLTRNYYRPVHVRELIGLGDLSTLGSEIGTKHDFHDYRPDQTTAYGRDRGEQFPAVTYPSRQARFTSTASNTARWSRLNGTT